MLSVYPLTYPLIQAGAGITFYAEGLPPDLPGLSGGGSDRDPGF